jgi:hypothetical protein
MAVPDNVTPDLAGVLDKSPEDHLLEVVVELAEPDAPADKPPAGRTERIAKMKESFHEQATPLEESITSLGGEVLGKAWINRTIHARVPARAVPELARAGAIAAVDVPHGLTPEQTG